MKSDPDYREILKVMKELPTIRFFALWLIGMVMALATLAPLVSAIGGLLK